MSYPDAAGLPARGDARNLALRMPPSQSTSDSSSQAPHAPTGAEARRSTRAAPPVPAPSLVHGGWSRRRYFAQHFQGAVFPMAAGMLIYGWRALLVIAVVVGSTLLATLAWRQIGRRGRDLSLSHAAWMALLLALTLPAPLGAARGIHSHAASFWLLPAAGALLAIVLWALRGLAGSVLHPVAVVNVGLALVPAFHDMLAPQYVLQREHLFFGDVLDAPPEPTPLGTTPWWFTRDRTRGHDAVRTTSASESLIEYTRGHRDGSTGDRGVLLLQGLLRDRLPPLEDLVMAGNPGPIGTSSIIFVIVGGLFLLYRGVIDYRIPALIIATAFVALLVLPVPVAITDAGPRWSWLAFREASVGWAVAVTFVNYQLAASPAVFMACFLATAPAVRPITRRGRTVFAIAIGLLTAVMQLYVSVSWGPYAALLIAGLLTPIADRIFQPKPLA